MNVSSYETDILEILHNIKHQIPETRAHTLIPVYDNGVRVAHLRLITSADLGRPELIQLLAKWRTVHEHWFPAQFKVTAEGTKRWLELGVLECKDRILFMLEDERNQPIGHMGFYRFNFAERHCEIDNVVRGEAAKPGIMTPALQALMRWGLDVFQPAELRLSTYAENDKAISLYKRCGFEPYDKTPLVASRTPERVDWVPAKAGQEGERYSLWMRFKPNQ